MYILTPGENKINGKKKSNKGPNKYDVRCI